MNGFVDDELRVLVEVPVSASRQGTKQLLRVWVDTAFNGGLVVPREQIERLGLRRASSTDAILADGKTVELETFSCYLDWFGNEFRTQVVANDGLLPLLGTTLLEDRRLVIDYKRKTLALEENAA